MKNQVQLIAYADRLSGATLRDLHALVTGPLRGVFGGVHVLPFFHPIDGADAGFDPIDHTQVDPRLGDWDDVEALTRDIDVMADVIVNHMSVASPQFRDWSAKGAQSIYDGLFLTLDAVFPHGATERDLGAVYRPRPGLPLNCATLATGETRVLWTTFTPQQVDIDVRHPQGRAYLDDILRRFGAHGIRMVRLDAVGYAIKRAGDSCFMMPETFAFIEELSAAARSLGIEVLVEIHAHYQSQIDIAARVDWVYDFALSPLVLHAICFKTSRSLAQWIRIRPNNAVTVLDTHDGIGIIDVGADATDRAGRLGLVPPAELDRVVEMIHDKSRGQSRLATGAAASNLDMYQVNCTFFDALGRDERAYLLARAIQFFVPGVPQVYYVGLLAGHNDMELLARTGVGRDINRHYFKLGEAAQALAQPIVRQLLALIAFRNSQRAFDGTFELLPTDDRHLDMRWTLDTHTARLTVDFSDLSFELTGTGASGPFAVALDP